MEWHYSTSNQSHVRTLRRHNMQNLKNYLECEGLKVLAIEDNNETPFIILNNSFHKMVIIGDFMYLYTVNEILNTNSGFLVKFIKKHKNLFKG